MPQMSDSGFHCIAPDWIGFGFSDKPQPGYGFDYTEKKFHGALSDLLEVIGLGFRVEDGLRKKLGEEQSFQRMKRSCSMVVVALCTLSHLFNGKKIIISLPCQSSRGS